MNVGSYAGVPQINIDLMFSLPGQSLQQWEHSLQSAINLQPDHISTYNLSYEEDTDFFRHYGADAGNEETDVAMFTMADELLTAAGYRHYEISNYARPGCVTRKNYDFRKEGVSPHQVQREQTAHQGSGNSPAPA